MDQARLAVMHDCAALSHAGAIAFPEVVRRLHAAGVERYHADLSRGEITYYLPCGESHVEPTGGPPEPAAEAFSPEAVEAAIRAIQRGEIAYPEFLRRIAAAGCVGYFVQITGRRAQYFGRDGGVHVEPFPSAA